MHTLESIRSKLDSATDIHSVVKTMKAVAASNIHQYELAVASLDDYFRTVELGLSAYFRSEKMLKYHNIGLISKKYQVRSAIIVFGSDQGLVGRFNDSLTEFVVKSLVEIPGSKEIWPVGERIQLLVNNAGLDSQTLFNVPNTVDIITALVGEILMNAEQRLENDEITSLYIFHNQPKENTGYIPAMQRLLPLDSTWYQGFSDLHWPTQKIPEVAGLTGPTLQALIREYLFVSLFKACAESLASENSSRLNAMQRAEKNIDELLDELNHSFHRLRQSAIDEELFDVVAGFEAMKKE